MIKNLMLFLLISLCAVLVSACTSTSNSNPATSQLAHGNSSAGKTSAAGHSHSGR